MRILLTASLLTNLLSLGCKNWVECNTDSECPVTDAGTKLYCTPDHLCARGTPAGGLCAEIYPANAPANSIVIGALVNTTAGNDKLPLEAFKLGIDQVNQRRAPDPPLALHICEVSATADDPLKSMEVLARQRGAVAVVGPTSSSKVFAIKDEVIRSGIPIMSPSATSPEISSLGTTGGPVMGLFYRVAPSDALQGPVLSHQLPTPFPSTAKLALLFVDDPYGQGLKDAFLSASVKQPDLTISYKEPAAGPDVAGTQNAANMIINTRPDYVIAITNLYSDTVVKDLMTLPQSGPASKLIMADGAKNQNVLNLIGTPPQPAMNDHLKRISGTAPTVDSGNQTGTGAYQTFINDFKVRWPGDDPAGSIYTAYGFDAIYAVAIAIGAAGANVTPARVSEMLARLNAFDSSTLKCQPNASNQIVVGQSKYLEAKNKLAGNSSLVLQGASGTICFSPHGDRISGLYERWSIDTTAKGWISAPTS